MATDCIPQLTLKFQQKMKPVVACFDTEHASTDGGALLLKALDERLALTEDVAACLPDRRDPAEGPARTARPGAPAGVRTGLWVRGRPRCGPAGARLDAQAGRGPGSALRGSSGLAADAVSL